MSYSHLIQKYVAEYVKTTEHSRYHVKIDQTECAKSQRSPDLRSGDRNAHCRTQSFDFMYVLVKLHIHITSLECT